MFHRVWRPVGPAFTGAVLAGAAFTGRAFWRTVAVAWRSPARFVRV
ncbi:hypothetical protein ACFQYP_09870 [Nonomuraea antimicrobica]